METVRDEQVVTATTTDVLNGRELHRAPGPGAIAVWLGSSQNDSLASIRSGGRALAQAVNIPNRGAAGTVDENTMAPVAMRDVLGGELTQVDVTVVTGATIRIVTIWAGMRR